MTRPSAPRLLFAAAVVSTAVTTVAPAGAAPLTNQGATVTAAVGRLALMPRGPGRAAPARALLRSGAVPDGTAVGSPLLTAGARPACSNHQGKGPSRRMCEVVAGVTDHYEQDDSGAMAFEVRTCATGAYQVSVYADGHAGVTDGSHWLNLAAEDPRQLSPAIKRCRQGTL